MKGSTFAVLTTFLVGLPGTCCSAEDLKSYLTGDGKLTSALEVRDLQGGFAGFTGQVWKIEPTGEWVVTKVINEKTTKVVAKGKLSKEQMHALARELKKFDPATLPEKLGEERANPHEVRVKFGKRESVLILGTLEALPETKDSRYGASGVRFSGIVRAVEKAVGNKREGKPVKPGAARVKEDGVDGEVPYCP